jgi:hypothetical protein
MPAFREFGRAILVNAYAQLKQRTPSFIRESPEQRYADLVQRDPQVFQHARQP